MKATFLVWTVLLLIPPFTVSLEFFVTTSVLPEPSSQHTLVYDGDDSIYAIGGSNGKVVKYSIESGEAEFVGEFVDIDHGAAIMVDDEILYFGGRIIGQHFEASSDVYSFSTVANNYTRVEAQLPAPMQEMTLAWDPVSDVAYFLGGRGAGAIGLKKIYRFSVRTGEFQHMSYLPDAAYRGAGVYNSKVNMVLSIGGSVDSQQQWLGAFYLNPVTGGVTAWESALHNEISDPCAVYSSDDDFIYVFGSVRGLVRLDPNTMRSETIYLSPWPRLDIAPCVHVPKLSRIYILGGHHSEAEMDSDEIGYLDLAPLSVPTLVTEAILPAGLTYAASVYDGEKSIYIVGGYRSDLEKSHLVLRYSLDTSRVVVHGEFRPIADGAVIFHDEQIIHFGGWNANNVRTDEVYKYDIIERTYSLVGHIPASAVGRVSVAWDAENQVAYVFVGTMEEAEAQVVVRYDAATHDGNMSVAAVIQEPTADASAIWHTQQGVAYTLGTDTLQFGYEVMKFDPSESNVTEADVVLPHRVWFSCAVYTDSINGNVFLITGADFVDGPIKFDAASLLADVEKVQGWPRILRYASCVYVPPLERLYIIGGYRDNAGDPSNEISYVELGESYTGSTTPEESSTTNIADSDVPTSTESPTIPTTTTTVSPEPSSTSGVTGPEVSTDGAAKVEQGSALSPVLLYSLIIAGALVTFAAFAVFCRCVYRRGSRNKHPSGPSRGNRSWNTIQLLTDIEEDEFRQGKPTGNQNGDNDLVIDALAYNAAFEVAKEDLFIDLTRKLGSGHYGVVYKGHVKHSPGADPTPIAVKTVRLNTPVEYFKSLMSELKILAHVGHHENIANLVAAYSGNIKNGELYVGVELCSTSLLQHLKDQSHGYIEVMGTSAQIESTCDYTNPLATDLLRWGADIAAGMEFISQKLIVHGDLAARNVLLAHDRRAKICDFGLARQLVDYTYIKSHPDNLPWKWMAIESLTDLKFSTKSDVWAYGVTLWEIFSLGKPPFPFARWNTDFLKQLLAGHRLPKPDHADEAIYNVMLECWCHKREDRPMFSDLKKFFDGEVAKGAMDINELDGTDKSESHGSETLLVIGEDYT